jgi:hypothetical protein
MEKIFLCIFKFTGFVLNVQNFYNSERYSGKIPERVPGYIERILDDERNGFKFSEEQKESIRKIRQRSYEESTEIETFLHEISSKYYNYSE